MSQPSGITQPGLSGSKPRRYFRYRVTDVGGSMEGRIAEGDLTFDYWHGKSHTYNIYDLRKVEATGWYSVKSEGECTDEDYAKLADAGKAVAR